MPARPDAPAGSPKDASARPHPHANAAANGSNRIELAAMGPGNDDARSRASDDDDLMPDLMRTLEDALFDEEGLVVNVEEGPISDLARTSVRTVQSILTDSDVMAAAIDTDLAEASRREALRAAPITAEEFRRHVRWGGLCFRKLKVERVFLSTHARLHRSTIYIGYGMLVLLALLGPVPDVLREWFQASQCQMSEEDFDLFWQEGAKKKYCAGQFYTQFSSLGAMTTSLYTTQLKSPKNIFIFTCALAGCVCHGIIHGVKALKQKGYALIATCLVYAVILVSACYFCILNDEKVGADGIEQRSDFSTYVPALLYIFLWFSGTLFWQNAFLWLVALVAVLSTTLTVLLSAHVDGNYMDGNYIYLPYLPPILVLGIMILAAAYLAERNARKRFLQDVLVHKQQGEIIKQKTINQKLQRKLLENMLPPAIVDRIQMRRQQPDATIAASVLEGLSKRHAGVCILFADLAEFSSLTSRVDSIEVMAFLNDLFAVFDNLCDAHNVYKVETVGDCYVAVAGVVRGVLDSFDADALEASESKRSGAAENTVSMLGFAQAILRESKRMVLPGIGKEAILRIGIHTGPCMSGIVGAKNLRLCLFGDTMNVAARMKQKGLPGRIHVTEDVVDLACDYAWEGMALMAVKGKGMMNTYLLARNDEGVHPISEEGVGMSLQGALSMDDTCVVGADARPELVSAGDMSFVSLSEWQRGGRIRFETKAVSIKVFRENTYGLLCFRSGDLELLYMDAVARMTMRHTYVGYAVLFMAGVLGFIYTCFEQWYIPRGSFPAFMQNLSKGDWTSLQVFTSMFAFDITKGILASLAIVAIVGSLGHYFIHKADFIKNKVWAFGLQWSLYLALILSTIIHLRFFPGDLGNARTICAWTCAGHTIIYASAVFALFSGGFFFHNFLLWVAVLACFVGVFVTTIYEGIESTRTRLENADSFVYWSIMLTTLLVLYGIVILIGSFINDIASRRSFLKRILMAQQRDEIIKEKSLSEKLQQDLLENILPPSIVAKLQKHTELTTQTLRAVSRKHQGVSVLYADLAGFTAFSSQVDASQVMAFLNEMFNTFDALCDPHCVCKVETIGDCYVAVAGIERDDAEANEWMGGAHAAAATYTKNMLEFAHAMLIGLRALVMPGLNRPPSMRVGIHTGSKCISGVVGTKSLRFCLLGETVDMAEAMEQGGIPGCIHASEAVVDLAPGYAWERREAAFDHPATGPMATYLLNL